MTANAPPEPCDVLIIGGGPAGSTAAALLAERGRDVVVLEKAAHPRFHIGESLLPSNTAAFDRLGIRDQVAAMGVLKPGAEFVSDETGGSVRFSFALGLDKDYTYSWQVPRAPFDALLFQTARDRGARTSENSRVTEVQFAAKAGARAQVTAAGPDGQVRCYAPRFVLDASGRDTFLAGKLGAKQSNKRTNTAALYAHFRGMDRRRDDVEGYITVHLAEDGWFWMIPLPDGIMSVGFVGNPSAFKGRAGSAADLFMERLRGSPTVSARMRKAELVSDVTSTGNYSYRSSVAGGEGYLLIGDAFGFVDPVFSSGVLLAMTMAEMGADVADTWLDDPARGRAMARRMERDVRAAMDRISWLIYRINTPALRLMFMGPRNVLKMRDGLISLLTGNLYSDWRLTAPVLAFKATYHLISLGLRFGIRPRTPVIEPQQAAAA